MIQGLGSAGLTKGARVVIEKPLRHDLQSAIELNDQIHQVLDEDQIYRIDHFLGKEPVQDITYLRFANLRFEPIWNRRYVESVQITMAEDFGVDDRGSFYDSLGALRDVVQNHILQTLALVAMELPRRREHRCDPRREARPLQGDPRRKPEPLCAASTRAYGEIEGWIQTPPRRRSRPSGWDIQNWRWFGVPFFIRAGKQLAEKVTEVRGPPEPSANRDRRGPDPEDGRDRPPHSIPTPGPSFCLEAKQPGQDALGGCTRPALQGAVRRPARAL